MESRAEQREPEVRLGAWEVGYQLKVSVKSKLRGCAKVPVREQGKASSCAEGKGKLKENLLRKVDPLELRD